MYKNICVLRRKTEPENATKKQKRNETRRSTEDLEGKSTAFIEHKTAIDAVQFSLPEHGEEQIRRHDRVENAKKLTKIN